MCLLTGSQALRLLRVCVCVCLLVCCCVCAAAVCVHVCPPPSGDEVADTHFGNNNWYGHDTKLSWMAWPGERGQGPAVCLTKSRLAWGVQGGLRFCMPALCAVYCVLCTASAAELNPTAVCVCCVCVL